MAINNHIVNSFISGEASEKFLGRSDTQQFNQSCESIRNMLVHVQGGASRRGGTAFVSELSGFANDGETVLGARLFPFSPSDGTRWQICLIKIQIDSTDKIKCVARAYKVSDLSDEEIGMVDASVVSQYDFDSNTYENAFGTVVSNLDEIQFSADGNILVFTGPNFKPCILRYDTSLILVGTNFSLAFINNDYFTSPGVSDKTFPFAAQVIGAPPQLEITIADLGAGVFSLVPATFPADRPSWVGRRLRASTNNVTGAFQITLYDAVNNRYEMELLYGTTFGMSLPEDFGTDVGTSYEWASWDRGFWGWPRTSTFFESRLVFGGNKGFPDTMWFSQIGDIYEFTVRKLEQDPTFSDPAVASDQFAYSLKADKVGLIQWMSSSKVITVGTQYREFTVYGPDAKLSVYTTNITSNAETPHGSAYAQAIRLENTTVFLQRDRRSVRELVYNLDENSFKAANLSVIGEHMARKSTFENDSAIDPQGGSFSEMVFQQLPIPIIWLRDKNGYLSAMTREREQQVSAWHYHELGGTLNGVIPRVRSLSPCQIPGPVEIDELWVIVERDSIVSGNAATLFSVERMLTDFEGKDIQDWHYYDAPSDQRREQVPVYMDLTVFYTYETVTDISAIILPNIFAPETMVAVLIDGYYWGEFPVYNNPRKIDISGASGLAEYIAENPDFKIMIGYAYTHKIIPFCPEVPTQKGSSLGTPRRISEVSIGFYRTVGGKFGRAQSRHEGNTPSAGLEEIVFPFAPNSGDPIPMYSGEKRLDFPPGYEYKPRVEIQGSLPFPMHVTHIITKMVVYE